MSDEAVWVLVPAASEAFVYDDAGRLIEDGTWVYTWNAASHLTGLTRKAGTSADPHVASESISYGYDSDGRRTGRVHTVTKTGGQTEVAVSKVLWDGWQPVGEERTLNGLALPKRWFVWGEDVSGTLGGAGGIGGLVSIREEGERTLLPVDDGLGNITAVIDAATGNAVARYDYGPYGEIVGESGDIEACPFRYQSKWWDAAAGLSYFGYRHYSPRLGRWLSRDPLGEAGGMNLYAYCEGDPVNKYDYLGMDAKTNEGQAEEIANELFELVSNVGRSDFKTYHWTLSIPFTNKQFMWVGADGEYQRSLGHNRYEMISPGAIRVVERPAPVVSAQTDAMMIGTYSFGAKAAGGTFVVAVGVVLLSEALVSAVAVPAMVYGVYDGGGRLIEYVPVLFDSQASPEQIRLATENSLTGVFEVLPTGIMLKKGLSGARDLTVYGFRNSKDPQVREMLEQAKYGHVGFSFNGGKKIFGFGPHAPGLSAEELYAALSRPVSASFPGKLTNDTDIFVQARDLGLKVTEFKYDLGFMQYWSARSKAGLESLLPNMPWKRYALPDGFAPGIYNCATYPTSLGLPTPIPTGVLRDVLTR